MLRQSIDVKDQFGIKHFIQATANSEFANTQSFSNIKYITVDGEDIRPGYEMYFQSTLSGRIFKVL
ncbi:hypothetical protein [Acinetobacter beijerinckii]|uniref:hypothetical protein n=1 Tax=Acinetobacter beijerinckii TaxID=262668 RepID=UPI004054BE65